MKWPNAVSLSRPQVAEIGRRLRAAGYDVKTKDLDHFTINIVRRVAGADPEAEKEVQQIIESVMPEPKSFF